MLSLRPTSGHLYLVAPAWWNVVRVSILDPTSPAPPPSIQLPRFAPMGDHAGCFGLSDRGYKKASQSSIALAVSSSFMPDGFREISRVHMWFVNPAQ